MELQFASTQFNHVPFGYFLLNKQLEVVSLSEYSLTHFPSVRRFTDIVDSECHKKVIRFLLEAPSIRNIEANLRIHGSSLSLHDLHCYDEKDYIHLFCINKEKQIRGLTRWMDYIHHTMSLSHYDFTSDTRTDQDNLASNMKGMDQISRVTSGIINEIRNPLTTAKGFIQLIRPHLHKTGKGSFADVAIEEIERADSLLHEIDYFSSSLKPLKETAVLSKLLNETLHEVKREGFLQHGSLSIEHKNEDILLSIDKKQIKHALIHLIKNACEAVSDSECANGQITVYYYKVKEFAHILVQDNGIGMAKEIMQDIFNPFYTTKEKRAGLGLAISKKIVQAHGGSIQIVSSSKRGTTATLKLPI
jgi:signal transduction histidine kinase